MKRIAIIFLLIIILGLTAVQLLLKDEVDLWQWSKQKFTETAESVRQVSGARREIDGIDSLPHIRNGDTPLWQSDASRNRRLVLQHKIGGGATQGGFSFRNVIAVDFDAAGNLYVLDFGNKSIETFDSTGSHLRTIGVGPNRERTLVKPTDLAVHNQKIYVSDLRHGVLVFGFAGTQAKSPNIKHKIEELTVDANGEIYTMTPADVYLLHKFKAGGRELLAFGRQEEENGVLREVFGQGSLALDRQGNVYVSYTYPYRVVKYGADGRAQISFERDLGMVVNPPTIDRNAQGQIRNVFRQEVSYDLAVADTLVYNLVRTKGVRGGNVLDVFSMDGRYLQSIYLAFNATAMALMHHRVAFVRPTRRPIIEVYTIERF